MIPDGLQSRSRDPGEQSEGEHPTISVCRSCPEKSVFVEVGNTDDWIATDSAVEPPR